LLVHAVQKVVGVKMPKSWVVVCSMLRVHVYDLFILSLRTELNSAVLSNKSFH